MLKRYSYNEISPTGWLLNQLKIQANGLSGHLDLVWPDIADSAWIGGKHESWERVPYWLDGFIPLAFLLRDEELIKRAKKYIDNIIARQCEDGWICPCSLEERKDYDIWALFLITKVLAEYFEYTGDEKALLSCYKALKNCYELLRKDEIKIYNWGKARWFECFIAMNIVKEHYNEVWLDEFADILYKDGYHPLEHRNVLKHAYNEWRYDTHVVNLAMQLKGEEEYQAFKKLPFDNSAHKLLDLLLKYHGTGVGTFSGDECIAGKNPNQGFELCSVVEAMYSYERLFALTRDVSWLDQLEKVTFNALPATISYDMWSHQYVQQVNQVNCISKYSNPIYTTNGSEANVFGLEPHFGCCTSNFNQGWPKFVHNIFLREENNIFITSLTPCLLETEIDGEKIKIEIVSEYPFKDCATIKVSNPNKVNFNLFVHINKTATKVNINSKNCDVGLIEIDNDKDSLIKLDFSIKYIKNQENSYLLNRGPLIFSIPLKETYHKKEYIRDGVERKYPYCDYEITTSSKTNYCFVKGEEVVKQGNVKDVPFANNNSYKIEVNVAHIYWPEDDRYEGMPIATVDEIILTSDIKRITLLPYGATKLRMTALPLVNKKDLF